MYGSQSIFPGGSSSRPFLNMLNPMGRTYQGYMQANQSVVEEEDEENQDLEAGDPPRSSSRSGSVLRSPRKSHGKRKVSWGGDASEMNVLRPNIRRADPKDGDESSDGEVPADFMIEASSPAAAAAASQRRASSPAPTKTAKGKEREDDGFDELDSFIPTYVYDAMKEKKRFASMVVRFRRSDSVLLSTDSHNHLARAPRGC